MQNQVQINAQYWRQNVWQSPEVTLNMPEFPQALQQVRDMLERHMRNVLQQRAVENPLRALLFNQMSYNNYQNADWVAMITSAGLLMETLIFAQRAKVDDQLTVYVLDRTCNAFLVRLVDHNQNLANYMNSNEWNVFNQFRAERDQDVNTVTQYLRSKQQQFGYPQPQGGYQQHSYQQQQQMAAGSLGNSYGTNLRQPLQSDPLTARRTANLEAPVVTQMNTMEQAFQTAVVDSANRSMRADEFLAARGAPQNSSPIMESITLSPGKAPEYQRGGETIDFDNYFTASDQVRVEARREPETLKSEVISYEKPKEYKGYRIPMVEIDGRKWPVVYNTITHYVNERGELIMTNMRYEDHELTLSNIKEEPGLRTIPIFEEEPVEEQGTVERHWLHSSNQIDLDEPLLNIELDSAFQYTDFDCSAYQKKAIVKFVNLRTDAALLADAKEFYERFADFAVGSKQDNMVALWTQLKDMFNYSHAMARKLNARATKAVNHVISKVLNLDFESDSFIEDFPEIHDYLKTNYGELAATRFKQNLQPVHNALCCLLDYELGYTVIDRTAVTIQAANPSGIKWDQESCKFKNMSNEEISRIEAFKDEVQTTVGPIQDCAVQLVTNEYCALLPVEYEHLKLLLSNETAVILPSVTPELADFVNDLFEGIGGVNTRFVRVLLGTVDGVMLHVYPTPGVDVDNRPLYAIERVNA